MIHILSYSGLQSSNIGFHISRLTRNEHRHTGHKQLRNQVMQTSCIEAGHLNAASSKGQ